jgi:hypothetical protein
MWDALSNDRTGLSFATDAGPRQRSHSRVRVPWNSDHILLSQIRDSLNLEGQVHIFISQEQGDPLIPPRTGFPLCCPLQLAGL